MSHEQTLQVALGERSYPIVIGSGLLARANEFIIPQLASPRAIIISDEHVGPYYAKTLENSLKPQGIQVQTIIIPAGEGSKSFASLESLMNQLLALQPDRKTTLIALGGGVVGDLVGFAASILLRGVPFIQVPTTLLAQVDSSVGGKTAINAASGKNLIGSFYQPKLVLADSDTLATLPLRELQAGYAEIIKYGLIMDAGFYSWCLQHGVEILANSSHIVEQAVLHACRCKADIVARDERESDLRALLNFGHTFGHALEAETGYGDKLLHGEAVAIGMVMACDLSAKIGRLPYSVGKEVAAHFKQLGMLSTPTDIEHPWNAEAIAAHFAQDKKAENGALTFVVLDKIGQARVAKNVEASVALETVRAFLEG